MSQFKYTLHEEKLTNGTRLLIINYPNCNVVWMEIMVLGGFKFAPKEKYEIPHLLEHLMFTGNQKYPTEQEFSAAVEKNGAYHNASTSQRTIRYDYTFNKYELKRIIELAALQVTAPVFTTENVQKEIEVIAREIEKRGDTPNARVYFQIEQITYPEIPSLAERIKQTQKITLDDVSAYYSKTHTAKNTDILIAGSFTNPELKKLKEYFEANFKDYPKGQRLPIKETVYGDFAEKIVAKNDISANQIYLSFEQIEKNFPKKQGVELTLLRTMLDGSPAFRLYHKYRPAGLAYSVGTSFSWTFKEGGSFFFSFATGPKHAVLLFDVILKEVFDLVSGNFSEEELQKAKDFGIGKIYRNNILPIDFLNGFKTEYVNGEKLESVEEYLEMIKKVTKKDIIAAAKKFFAQKNWIVSVYGPKAEELKKEFKKVVEKYY